MDWRRGVHPEVAEMSQTWHRAGPVDRWWTRKKVTGGVFVLLLVVMAALSFSFGITYDEIIQQSYGELVYAYFLSGFTDLRATNFGNLYLYGGMFDLTCRIAQVWFEGLIEPYEIRHVVNSVYGWIGMVYTFRLGRIVGGDRAGWIALALLVSSPVYFGHAMNNPKDIPFATFYVVTLYYLAVLAREYPAVRTWTWLRVAFAVGLTLNARIGGLVLIAYLGGVLIVLALRRIIAVRRLEPALHVRTAAMAATVVPLALVLGTVFWPWAQSQPLTRPFQALEEVTHFAYGGNVLFDGVSYPVTELPWNYAPQWFLVTTPFCVLFGFLAALRLFGVPRLRAAIAGLLFATLFPVLYVMARQSVLYDGIRHLLFVYPPFVVCAALGIDFWYGRLRQWSPRAGWAFVTLCLVLGADTMRFAVVNHPHQTSYFNALAGGMRGAFGRYEQDYWAGCFKEAIEWLDEQPRQKGQTLRVWSSEPEHLPRLYPTRGLEFVNAGEPHEYVLTWLRGTSPELIQELVQRTDIAYQVTADTVPLCLVFRTTDTFLLPRS